MFAVKVFGKQANKLLYCCLSVPYMQGLVGNHLVGWFQGHAADLKRKTLPFHFDLNE